MKIYKNGDYIIMLDGKKRNKSQITGEKAVNILKDLFPEEWVVREYTPDYGIDLSVEIFEEYKSGYITTGEHIYFQVKGTEELQRGKYKVYERKNVEKTYENSSNYKEIEVVKFNIETSLLSTVERMGSAVPVLLTIVDIIEKNVYYVCLNDYIEKVIVPINPNYSSQKSITLNIPVNNVIKNAEDVFPINWYSKRAKLFALFNKVNYQNSQLKYIFDEDLSKYILHFANIIRRLDAWSASKYFYALKSVEIELDYFLDNGITKMAEDILNSMKKNGKNIYEKCWEYHNSYENLSLSEIENAIGLRVLWDNICNCANIFEYVSKEWFLPTHLALIIEGKLD